MSIRRFVTRCQSRFYQSLALYTYYLLLPMNLSQHPSAGRLGSFISHAFINILWKSHHRAYKKLRKDESIIPGTRPIHHFPGWLQLPLKLYVRDIDHVRYAHPIIL